MTRSDSTLSPNPPNLTNEPSAEECEHYDAQSSAKDHGEASADDDEGTEDFDVNDNEKAIHNHNNEATVAPAPTPDREGR